MRPFSIKARGTTYHCGPRMRTLFGDCMVDGVCAMHVGFPMIEEFEYLILCVLRGSECLAQHFMLEAAAC